MNQYLLPTVAQQMDDACNRIACGRAAARELTALVEGFGLKEAEFRLLWALLPGDAPLDQTRLAEFLGCSPAQVSSMVERQRSRGHIAGQTAHDRRRHVWRTTPQGRALLERIVAAKTASGRILALRKDSA